MNNRALALTLAAAVAAATLSTGAQAQLHLERQAEPVSYRDLDLAQPSDAAELHGRIVEAAESICGDPRSRPLHARIAHSNCFRHAVQGAVNRLDEPYVTQAHLARFYWAAEPGSKTAIRLAQR